MANTKLTEFDLKSAEKVLLYANTPYYVYKNLRTDKNVSYISQRLSSEEIISELEALMTRHELSRTEFVEAYSYMIALTFKNDKTSLHFLRTVYHDPKIRWFKEIINLHLSSFVSTNQHTINMRHSGAH